MDRETKRDRSLREAYLDAFLVVGRLSDGQVHAEHAAAIRQRALRDVQQARQSMLADGVPEEWVDAVQGPVVALIDEIARRCTPPGFEEGWSSMQFELYQRETLGREVFADLDKLRANKATPTPVLEIFARCLAYGLTGEYSGEKSKELRDVREGLANELSRRKTTPSPLAPDLFVEQVAEARMPLLPGLWIGVTALGVVMLLGLVLTAKLGSRALEVEEAVRATALIEGRALPSASLRADDQPGEER